MKLTPTLVILAIVAIVIIVLVIVFAVGRQAVPQPISTPSPGAELTPLFANSVNVANQTATNSATIQSASFAEGGFIVIHAATPEGAPGEVVGYSEYLTPGSYDDVEITFTKVVKAGDTLFAMLHSDDGDRTYGFPDEDLPLKDDTGKIILQKYTVTK